MRNLCSGLVLMAALALPAPASAEIIGGVDFPGGAASFADSIVSYTPGPGGLTAPHMGDFNALGIPNYPGGVACASQADCSYVSLGDGGSIVAQFIDNVLTGSDSAALDLWIFEIGPDVEDMFVDISTDGLIWLPVGSVGGATSGVDLDFFGYGTGSSFSYVRLTDDPDLDGQSGATVGADIDAIGAISTRVTGAVPEPATWAMMLLGFGAMGAMMRVARRKGAVTAAA